MTKLEIGTYAIFHHKDPFSIIPKELDGDLVKVVRDCGNNVYRVAFSKHGFGIGRPDFQGDEYEYWGVPGNWLQPEKVRILND